MACGPFRGDSRAQDAKGHSSQPRPLSTWVSYLTSKGQTVTAIFRQWRPGDPGRCRLCDACSAWRDGCLITTAQEVAERSAALFDCRRLGAVDVGVGDTAAVRDGDGASAGDRPPGQLGRVGQAADELPQGLRVFSGEPD
jgi:hypothetical protein